MVMKILVTGAAGFIGFHTAAALLARGDTVIGLDNLNDYYDVALKEGKYGDSIPIVCNRPKSNYGNSPKSLY